MDEVNARFVQGDVAAFEALFRAHQRPVYGWILRLAPHHRAAEGLPTVAPLPAGRRGAAPAAARAHASRVAAMIDFDDPRLRMALREAVANRGDQDPDDARDLCPKTRARLEAPAPRPSPFDWALAVIVAAAAI